MVLQKINNLRQRENGFTIVELLIVIVVIGILAAITIIAYNGITSKAYTTRAQTNAEAVQKVAEAYNADNASYTDAAGLTSYNGSTKLPTGITLYAPVAASCTSPANTQTCLSTASGGSGTTSTYDGKSTILFLKKADGTGDCIGYFNFSNPAATSTVWVYAGGASSATVATNTWTCS